MTKVVVDIEDLSPDDKKKLRKAILELNDCLTRISAERDLQKEIITKINDDLNVDKKLVRKMAQSYFKSSFDKETEENDKFETAFTLVLKETAS